MRCTQPLPDYLEFSIIDNPGWREFRVQNRRLFAGDAATSMPSFLWMDAAILLCIAIMWPMLSDYRVAAGTSVLVLVYLYTRCTQILWESVIALPSLGMQFECHRGLPWIPISVSRRFIPLSRIRDFVINEGLYGWNIRYYAMALHQTGDGTLKLDVAFENLLPHLPVLSEVYRGIHETLFASTLQSTHAQQ